MKFNFNFLCLLLLYNALIFSAEKTSKEERESLSYWNTRYALLKKCYKKCSSIERNFYTMCRQHHGYDYCRYEVVVHTSVCRPECDDRTNEQLEKSE